MKKILFSCLVALGFGANAQFNHVGDFEDETNVGQYGQFGTGTITAAAACTGAFGGQLAIVTATAQTGWMVQLDVLEAEGQVNNGQKADLSISYKKAANVAGTLYLCYMNQDEETGLWNIAYVGAGVPLAAAATTTCSTITGSIPAGTLQPGKIYGVGAWFVKTTGNTGGNIYIDNISILQEAAPSAPSCTTLIGLTNGSVVAAGNYALTWNATATAVNYKVTVGTTPGGSNIFNGTVAGTTTNVVLNPNTTYYTKVVPSNLVGDATGCTEISFSTNTSVAHCGPLTSSLPTAVAPIRSVAFAGVTNTSEPTATGTAGIGSYPAHQDFTTTEFPVTNNVTTLPITIQGATNGNPLNGWAASVFVDWNNDGDFDDAGEAYFNTFATKLYAGGVNTNPVVLTGNITIPAGTTLGKKFMRVKYNFQAPTATTLRAPLLTGCANMENGQAEDYTIDYTEFMAVSDVNKAGISVFPNPFTDVLKISDVKGVKSISVNDISGRQVSTLAPSAELNLSGLKAGLYIVNLQMTDGSVKSFKAIKK